MIKKPLQAMLLAVLLTFSFLVSGQEISWYKHFTGTIGDYPVTLHTHKTGNEYSGYYYYEKTQRPIFFSGTDKDSNGHAGTVNVTAFTPGPLGETETLSFDVQNGSLTGEWKQETNGKKLTLKAAASASADFEMIYAIGSQPLRKNKEDSPTADYAAATIWPSTTNTSAAFLKSVINKQFNNKLANQPIGQFFLQQKKNFFAAYQKENKDVPDSELLETPSAFGLSEDERLMIVYQSPALLTVADFNYAYSGGAHGNYGTAYISLDMISRKTLMLSRVIMPAGKKPLNKLVEKYFRKEYDVKPGQPLTEGGLFEDSIAANQNFFLTGKGIGFSYNPYEIGPYVMGEITVFIPYAELTPYLQPSFKKLLEIN